MKRIIFTLIGLFLLVQTSFSQDKKWSIQECIDYALENNLDMKQSDITVRISEYQVDQNKMSRYPNLNSNMAHAYNFGRSIDPFTNQFKNQSVQSNSFNLSSSVTLFSAYKIKNNINLSQKNLEVSKENRNTLVNNVSLRVADAYLNILFNQEQLKIALNQEKLSQEQMEITQKLFKAGKVDKTELSNIQAQLSNNTFQVLSARNSIRIAKLNMVQLLQLPSDTKFEIETPNINVEQADVTMQLATIIDKALSNMPEMKSANLKVESAKINQKIAKADLYPVLSLRANVNTVYSQSRKEPNNPVSSIIPIGLVEGTNQTVVTQVTNYDFSTTPFGTQIKDNFGQSVGFNLSIPIFNNHRIKNNIKISELTQTREELNRANTQNQLINDVTLAYTQYLNAQKEYLAASQNYNAQKQAYELNKRKADAGLIGTGQMLVFRNNMDNAQINMNRIKYQYIFSKLRIYFYQKSTIQLD